MTTAQAHCLESLQALHGQSYKYFNCWHQGLVNLRKSSQKLKTAQ